MKFDHLCAIAKGNVKQCYV